MRGGEGEVEKEGGFLSGFGGVLDEVCGFFGEDIEAVAGVEPRIFGAFADVFWKVEVAHVIGEDEKDVGRGVCSSGQTDSKERGDQKTADHKPLYTL